METLDDIYVRTGWTDEEIGSRLGIDKTYANKIRNGKMPAGKKLARKIESLSREVSPQGQSVDLPWDELLELRVRVEAKACGMSLPSFVVECLRRFSSMTSEVVQKEMENARKASSALPSEDAKFLTQAAAGLRGKDPSR